MRLREDLMRGLAKVMNDTRRDEPFLRISNVIQVSGALVRQRMEDIQIIDGDFTPLLVAKHKIDPLLQPLADVRTL
jgi:hypothetical protein